MLLMWALLLCRQFMFTIHHHHLWISFIYFLLVFVWCSVRVSNRHRRRFASFTNDAWNLHKLTSIIWIASQVTPGFPTFNITKRIFFRSKLPWFSSRKYSNLQLSPKHLWLPAMISILNWLQSLRTLEESSKILIYEYIRCEFWWRI